MVLSGRACVRHYLGRAGLWQARALLCGSHAAKERAVKAMTADGSMGYVVAGSIDPHFDLTSRDPEGWYRLMLDHDADLIAVAGEASGDEAEADTLAALSLTSIPVTLIPAFSSISVVGCRPQYVPGHDAMLMTCQPRLTEPVTRRLKSVMDYTVAALLCVFFSPLFFAIAMAIRSDGGPVIYRHKRIGAEGRSFSCLKFRSMKVNSDEILAELLESDPVAAAQWASTRKLTDDPRITPIGKFLRMTSLDELPQLWNVLRGEMSLVGPRPIVQAEVEFYGRWFGFYTHMKPGLTGLWQASGRSTTTYSHRVQLDVWYARNWSLWQDIAILLMTVPAVLLRKGAI